MIQGYSVPKKVVYLVFIDYTYSFSNIHCLSHQLARLSAIFLQIAHLCKQKILSHAYHSLITLSGPSVEPDWSLNGYNLIMIQLLRLTYSSDKVSFEEVNSFI